MKQTILLICLNKQYAQKIAEIICDEIGFFYLDCEELLAYELANREQILKKCGIAYLKKQEKKFVKGLTDYSNTVMSMGYELYTSDNNHQILNENLLTFYLALNIDEFKETEFINKIAYKERDKDLKKIATNIINCNNITISEIVRQITEK